MCIFTTRFLPSFDPKTSAYQPCYTCVIVETPRISLRVLKEFASFARLHMESQLCASLGELAPLPWPQCSRWRGYVYVAMFSYGRFDLGLYGNAHYAPHLVVHCTKYNSFVYPLKSIKVAKVVCKMSCGAERKPYSRITCGTAYGCRLGDRRKLSSQLKCKAI